MAKMGPVMGPVVTIVVFIILQNVEANTDKVEPMVAFMCNKSAMHKGVNGWIADPSTDCLNDKVDILNYCKRTFPNHDITNIVESSKMVTISDWPAKNGRKHTHVVRPYRCIVGSFQSDALLVPQHCVFDHHHDTEICESFDYWNGTAIRKCSDRGMHCQSFAMLLDCKLDSFNGVEFVCCPEGKSVGTTTKLKVDSDNGGKDVGNNDENITEDHKEHKGKGKHHHGGHKKQEDKLKAKVVDLPNVYEAYLKGQKLPQFQNEHQSFIAARKFMRKKQQAKTTKLMKEWQLYHQKVADLRKTDFKAAEKQDKEVAERFQRLYHAYEQEEEAEKRQLLALHQQHIQSNFNHRKRKTMEKYMAALQNRDAALVLKYLSAYIRVEEKDRMHTADHFEHIRYTAPDEAARIHPHVIEHLKLADARINQSLEMLARYPEIQKKVYPEITKFLTRYKSVDISISNIVGHSNSAVDTHLKTSKDGERKKTSNKNKSKGAPATVIKDKFDPETMEDEHAYEHNKNFAAHQMDHSMDVEQSVQLHQRPSTMGGTFGIAIGSIAVFVIIVVAIVMLRRRSSRHTVTHGYVEVDPAASPEERHVANMQMNGYENPTYRYFEMQPQ